MSPVQQEGYVAKRHGRSIDSCPYPVNTAVRREWQKGWRLASLDLAPKKMPPAATKGDYQWLKVDTILGVREVKAPDGWIFDRTAITAWLWIVSFQHDLLTKDFKRARDRHVLVGKVEALALVLANSLGMAGTYWELEAKSYAAAGERL
jgi:ribosome modulation factor